MAGDISRRTFDREKRYAGVFAQQGRVLSDADVNEQVEIGERIAGYDQKGFLEQMLGVFDAPGRAQRLLFE